MVAFQQVQRMKEEEASVIEADLQRSVREIAQVLTGEQCEQSRL